MNTTESKSPAYTGNCFCGAVQIALRGEPEAMGYCHCASCRHWSAGPVNAFTLWKPDAFEVTHGAEHLGTFNKSAGSARQWCRLCGGHVCTVHPGMGLIDVYAAVLPALPFRPGVHVHYQESVLPVHDGLPKYQDGPSEMGGSGVLLDERDVAGPGAAATAPPAAGGTP